jgi:hypothetical protein
MGAMSGIGVSLVAGARGLEIEARQSSDDKVLSLKVRIEIEAEEPTSISADDLVDAVAYAVRDLVRGLGIYVDDSETCEASSNVYFKSLDAQWERIDFCLGQIDREHLHVTANVGYTLNRRSIKAEVKFEKVSE